MNDINEQDFQAIQQQYYNYKQQKYNHKILLNTNTFSNQIDNNYISPHHSHNQFSKSLKHFSYTKFINSKSPIKLKIQDKIQNHNQNCQENIKSNFYSQNQQLSKIIKALGCNNLIEAYQKIQKLNQTNKLIIRIKEMVQICQPQQKDITLNKCWKFIKKAVYDMQKSKVSSSNLTLTQKDSIIKQEKENKN